MSQQASLGQTALSCEPPGPARTAFLFPGLGGEGFHRIAEFVTLSPTAQDVLWEADALVAPKLGCTVSEFVREQAQSHSIGGGMRSLRLIAGLRAAPLPTLLAHSALFTIEYALAKAWIAWGLEPNYVCGYSLGELTAACVAGLFEFKAGLALVMRRAEILQGLPRGGMLAILSDAGALAEYLESAVHIVAVNSPNQVVVGGDNVAITDLERRLSRANIINQRVPVEFPFHTPLLEACAHALSQAVLAVTMAEPKRQLVSTVTGTLIDPQTLKSPEHWVQHLCRPVRFVESLAALNEAGTNVYFEVGPTQSLSPLVAANRRSLMDGLFSAAMPGTLDERNLLCYLSDTFQTLKARDLPIRADAISRVGVATNVRVPQADPLPVDGVVGEVQALWARLLYREDVQPDDDLFALGGSSLTILKIVQHIRENFYVNLSISDVFKDRTPRALAGTVRNARGIRERVPQMLDLPGGLSIRYHSRLKAQFMYEQIFEKLIYMKHNISIPPGSTVVDVGADIGLFSLFLSNQPGVKTISLETSPQLFEIMQFNLIDLDENAECLEVERSDVSIGAMLSQLMNRRDVQKVALLKVSVGELGPLALERIAPNQWPKVRQVIIELPCDLAAAEAPICLLNNNGFSVVADRGLSPSEETQLTLFGRRQVAPHE